MKKIFVLTAILALFAVPSYAILHLGVSAGYAYASMDDVKTSWETAKKEADAMGADSNIQDFGSSIFVNADLGIGIIPFLHIGPRVGIQYVFPVESDITVAGVAIWKEQFSALLVPLELGATLNIGVPMAPISATVGAYAGYGLAYGLSDIEFMGETISIPYDGGGFMADLAAALEFNVLPFLNLSINAGYRYALVENINVTTEVKLPDGTVIIDAGEQAEDLLFTGGKRRVNFTGFLIGAGLNIRF